MKTYLVTVLVISLLSSLVFATVAAFNASGDGIIILEGFSEAVGFCGTDKFVAYTPGGTAVYEKGNTFVVNNGHLKDKRLKELKKLTHKTCKELVEKNNN